MSDQHEKKKSLRKRNRSNEFKSDIYKSHDGANGSIYIYKSHQHMNGSRISLGPSSSCTSLASTQKLSKRGSPICLSGTESEGDESKQSKPTEGWIIGEGTANGIKLDLSAIQPIKIAPSVAPKYAEDSSKNVSDNDNDGDETKQSEDPNTNGWVLGDVNESDLKLDLSVLHPVKIEPDSDHEPVSTKSKSRRAKRHFKLKDQEEEIEIIQWVEQNPCLWYNQHHEYKNKTVKDKLWQAKADELGYDVEKLKIWYKSLRDRYTRLQRADDDNRHFTEREKWIIDQFVFLKENSIYRREPSRELISYDYIRQSFGETMGQCDAELLTTEDRLAISEMEDEDNSQQEIPSPSTSIIPTKRYKRSQINDQILLEMQRKVDNAHAQLQTVKEYLNTSETISERTAFLEWVQQVCKHASEDQFEEFQQSFITMYSNWKKAKTKRNIIGTIK